MTSRKGSCPYFPGPTGTPREPSRWDPMAVDPQPCPVRRPSSQDWLAPTYPPRQPVRGRWRPPEPAQPANPDIALSARPAAEVARESAGHRLASRRLREPPHQHPVPKGVEVERRTSEPTPTGNPK